VLIGASKAEVKMVVNPWSEEARTDHPAKQIAMLNPIAWGNGRLDMEYSGNVITAVHQNNVVFGFGIALDRHSSALSIKHLTGDRRGGIFITTVAVRSTVKINCTAPVMGGVR
jgi:hypothetical protein